MPKPPSRTMRAPIPMGMPVFETAVIVESDPAVFARELKDTLNRLVKDGFQIQSMMERPGGALVITGHKVDLLPPEAPPVNTPDDVIYTYLVGEKQEQFHFRSLEKAMAMVIEHMKDDCVLPVDITEVRFTRYNPLDLVSTPRRTRSVE